MEIHNLTILVHTTLLPALEQIIGHSTDEKSSINAKFLKSIRLKSSAGKNAEFKIAFTLRLC